MINFDLVIQKERVFALEISRSRVRIMKLHGNADKMKTISFAEIKIPKSSVVGGVVRREQIVAEAIKEALNTTYPQKIKTPYVITALPDEKIFVKVEEFPYLEKEDLRKALSLKVESLIALPLSQVYWDWHRIYSSKEENKVLVLISAVEKECADSYSNTLQLAGLIPLDFEIPASAAGRAIINTENKNDPHMFINMTESTTVVSIWDKGGIFFNTSLKIGQDQLQKVIYDYYEPRKTKESLDNLVENIDVSNLEPELESRIDELFKDLFEELQNVINYHEEKFGSIIKAYTLFGTGSEIKNIDSFISKKIEKEVKFANPSLNIYPKPQFLSHKKIHPHVVLLGLALRGIKSYKEISDINLLPDTIQKSYINKNIKDSSFKNLFILALNNFFIIGVLVLYIMIASTHNDLIKQANKDEENLLYSNAYKESSQSISNLAKQLKNYNSIFGEHYQYSLLLDKFSGYIDNQITISSIEISGVQKLFIGKKTAVDAKQIKSYLYIKGKADTRNTALDLVKKIKKDNFFVTTVFPIYMYEKNNEVYFEIEAEIVKENLLLMNFIKTNAK